MRLVLLSLLAVPACSLVRSPIVDRPDAGMDAPVRDVPAMDVPGLDAPDVPPDIPGLDAPIPDVPMPDVPTPDVPTPDVPVVPDAPDAFVPPDVPTCPPMESACDRVDEDCDGTTDDGVCPSCIAVTVGGRAYLSCAATTGIAAWQNQCGQLAPGYVLATFSSGTEQDMMLAQFRASTITGPHWIGLNDFETNGTYVWFDRSTTFTPTLVGAEDSTRSCITLADDGSYAELDCTAMAPRILCEAAAPAGACGGSEGSTCNGVDEDCDGTADDGLSCGHICSSWTFWDRVYYTCNDTQNFDAVVGRCTTAIGGAVAALTSPELYRITASTMAAELWVGMRQRDGASSEFASWAWIAAPGATYAIPTGRGIAPWDGGGGGQPNDNGGGENAEQNCASMRTDDDLEDDNCGDSHHFVCERRWSY
jgi:hypothetical protein